MNQAVAPYKTQAFKAKLVVLNGPLEGSSFKLIANQIYIGRSPNENDIILSHDSYCSRKHALITFDNNNYSIQKLSDKTSISVNKKIIQNQKKLKNNDVIVIGQTQMQLKLFKEAQLAVVRPHHQGQPPLINQNPSQKQKKAKNLLPLPRLILIALIGATFYFLATSPDPSIEIDKENTKLRTQQDIEDDIAIIEKMHETQAEDKQKLKNPVYKNAQIAYLKGMRDYRKGLFGRARESFRVCQTLYPDHQLCTGYLKKATMKHQQLAQRFLILGKNYLDKKQYKQCASSFQKVRVMMSHDKSHELYKEALSNFKYCQLQVKNRY